MWQVSGAQGSCGALARGEGAAVVALLGSGPWPEDCWQLAGDGLRVALANTWPAPMTSPARRTGQASPPASGTATTTWPTSWKPSWVRAGSTAQAAGRVLGGTGDGARG